MTSLATDPAFATLLTDSYQRFVGESLVPQEIPAADVARWLYEDAPFVVLSHNTDADPCFVYANRTAQRCFEYDWAEFTTLRSRFSAEEVNREERARLLDDVRAKGYAANVHGQRIARSGRRFWIENGIVWNLVDQDGTYRGQAAVFANWPDA